MKTRLMIVLSGLAVASGCGGTAAAPTNVPHGERLKRAEIVVDALALNIADESVIDDLDCFLDDNWNSPSYQAGFVGASPADTVAVAIIVCPQERWPEIVPAVATLLGTAPSTIQPRYDSAMRALADAGYEVKD